MRHWCRIVEWSCVGFQHREMSEIGRGDDRGDSDGDERESGMRGSDDDDEDCEDWDDGGKENLALSLDTLHDDDHLKVSVRNRAYR